MGKNGEHLEYASYNPPPHTIITGKQHMMDPTFARILTQSRGLCPFVKRTPASKLGMLVRQYSVVGGGGSAPLLARAGQCPYMSQAIATSTDSEGGSGKTLGAASSAMAAPHPLTPSWLQRSGGRCPVGGHTLGSTEQTRAYASQRRSAHASAAMGTRPVAAPYTTNPTQKRTPGSGLGRLPQPAPHEGNGFDFEQFYHKELERKHSDDTYRYFNNINRLATKAPMGHLAESPAHEITVWCSNDYQNMSRHPRVLSAMTETLQKYGAGAGGTRNIAGHNMHVERVEEVLSRLHRKDAALVFGSCYAANDAALSILGSKLPNCVILSDSSNHASMIQGIKHSGAKKMVYRHNDLADLEAKLQALPVEVPKIIAFESVYSMCGTIGPIQETVALAKKYGAITFLDEVHAVGMYGPHGAGVAEHLDWELNATMPPGKLPGTVMDSVDIITGTLGKAYGNVGGYIAGSNRMVDVIRSFAPQFIFSTTLPPAVLSGAATAIEVLMESNHSRQLQQLRTRELKNALLQANIPLQSNPSHIVPVLVGSAEKAKLASDMLLNEYGCYVQPINYPTVAHGLERLRITPTPQHTSQHVAHLVSSLEQVWQKLGLRTVQDLIDAPHDGSDALADLFRNAQFAEDTSPLWTDAMLSVPSGQLNAGAEAPLPPTVERRMRAALV
ncbi:5-aminolevulinate synthase [Malassezia sp. CBS 17886]|nr:5-aminolevulinate synthase [Malassezia sp. CBS 17886]